MLYVAHMGTRAGGKRASRGRQAWAATVAPLLVVAAACSSDGSTDQSGQADVDPTAAAGGDDGAAATTSPDTATSDTAPSDTASTGAPATEPDTPPETLPFALDVSGAWSTDYGTMVLDVAGADVTGPYGPSGTIEGVLDGNTLTGFWYDSTASQSCEVERNGTVYWGPVEFEFDPIGFSFEGHWGYCDGPPSETGWDGNRSLELDPIDTGGARAPSPPLVEAVFGGDLAAVESLLASGEDPNLAEESQGWTPLLVASQEGATDIASALIEAGADVDRGSDDDWTPLMIAAQNGHDDVLVALIEAGANPRVARADNWTPLHSAVTRENIGATRILTDAGVPLEAATDGFTVLTYTAQDGLDAFATLLIDAGASTQGAPTEGPTPLYIAAQNGHGQMVMLLLEAGADPDDGGTDSSPIIQAAAQRQVDMLALLVDGGADVDATREDSGWTALMWAANNGDVDSITELLSLGADPTLTADDGRTAQQIAEDLGLSEAAAVL